MTLKYIQIIILAAVFSLQYFVEHLFPQRRELNSWRNERFNLMVGALNVILSLLPASLLVQLVTYIETKQVGLFYLLHFPFWLRLAGTFFLMDLWMYAWHRMNHEVPLLWRFHAFHHRDEHMNTTTALRFHIVELLFSYPLKALVCLLLGIGYVPLLVYEIAFFISVIMHHSNMYITEEVDNAYRKVFVSPLMHRIHHSVYQAERNANYGALFSFWDRLFGTWWKKAERPVRFGVEE